MKQVKDTHRKILLWFTSLLLIVPTIAVAAPPIGETLQTWMDQTDARLDAEETATATQVAVNADIEARVAALEDNSTTTTTTAPTTTTTAPVLDPSGPITITASNVIIENKHFTGSSGNCVTVQTGADNITIRNSKFTNCHKGVYAHQATNVTVVDNVFEANQSSRGRNAVQFDKVTHGLIARNTVTATNGATLAEDHFNLYQSNGTSANPIIVEDNTVTGGGPSQSGSCIMAGDGGGSYQIIRDNVCTNPGQVGIGIASGNNVTVTGNQVTSTQFAWSNVGIYVWNQYAPSCFGHSITNNTVSWINSAGQSNPFWNGNNCGAVTITGNSWQ